jgi:hypothetical protein
MERHLMKRNEVKDNSNKPNLNNNKQKNKYVLLKLE